MTRSRDSYHHGDLPAALLDAAEAVLAETGLDGFSLRRVAARVGVSHSAPAHHFGDAAGLLAALATRGFERLLDAMRARQATADPDPVEQLMASGFGYIDFAQRSPALFRLIFGAPWPAVGHEALEVAANAALGHLAADLARLRGAQAFAYPEAWDEVLAIWSMAHGFAELLVWGRLKPAEGLTEAGREALFRRMVAQKLRFAERLRA
jgi:AcrR family transcriptional regulator